MFYLRLIFCSLAHLSAPQESARSLTAPQAGTANYAALAQQRAFGQNFRPPSLDPMHIPVAADASADPFDVLDKIATPCAVPTYSAWCYGVLEALIKLRNVESECQKKSWQKKDSIRQFLPLVGSCSHVPSTTGAKK